MNIEQRNQIKDYCNQFSKDKLIESVYTHYPDNKTWSTTLVDIYSIENMTQLFSRGYISGDLTGDGIVESSDYSLIENNLNRILSRP